MAPPRGALHHSGRKSIPRGGIAHGIALGAASVGQRSAPNRRSSTGKLGFPRVDALQADGVGWGLEVLSPRCWHCAWDARSVGVFVVGVCKHGRHTWREMTMGRSGSVD